jgi:hypothetical protein
MKNVIPDTLGDPGRRMVRPVLVDQEAVFRFEPEDTIQHVTRLSRTVSDVVLTAAPIAVRQCDDTMSVRRCRLNGRRQHPA